MTNANSKRLLVMAGGTGGHIFPGAAVAQQLQAEGWQIHWLGTPARMEAQLVPKLGFDISFIDVSGVRGNGLLRLLASPFRILRAIGQARKVIKQFRPDVVLGMGGFASGPGGIAAWLSGTPLVIHEQNAIAGMTNKILSRFAKKMLLGFENGLLSEQGKQNSNSKVEWVGNPVRSEIAAIGAEKSAEKRAEKSAENGSGKKTESSAALEEKVNILVVGGSLGAKCLNEHVPRALAELLQGRGIKTQSTKTESMKIDAVEKKERPNISVQHQCGRGHGESVQREYQACIGDQFSWQVSEFIDDMVAAYHWADLIVCRAGALTVAEVAAAGRSAIFVPLPHAVDDHQTWNARSLVDKKAGWLLPQPDLEQGKLVELLAQIVPAPELLMETAQKARQLAKTDATHQVVRICYLLANGETSPLAHTNLDNTELENTKLENRAVVKQSNKEGA